jgi:hypothetical protein
MTVHWLTATLDRLRDLLSLGHVEVTRSRLLEWSRQDTHSHLTSGASYADHR